MKKKSSKFLALVIISSLLLNSFIQPNKVYAYITTSAVLTGINYSFGLKSDGTLYSWGYNNGALSSSPLGLGYNSNPVPLPTQILTNVKNIASGDQGGYAVMSNGSVMVWGGNNMCQLGIGGSDLSGPTNKAGYKSTSLHPYLSNVDRIVSSDWADHSFAFLNDGTIVSWGYNLYGQLGNGKSGTGAAGYAKNNWTPATFTALSGVRDIAVGSNHTLFLLNNGNVYSAGYNSTGQLGINSTTNKSTPTYISSLSGVSRIYAGSNKSFAILDDGTVKAWGHNSTSGGLGIGVIGNKLVPTLVPGLNGTDITKMTVSQYNAYALMSDGTVKATGSNAYGQLGSGTTNSLSFITVPGINDAIDIDAGEYYVLILRSDGTIYAMGSNSTGQLGIGTTDTLVHNGVTVSGLTLVADTIPPVAPTMNPNITTPTNGNVVVTVNYPSDAAVKQYRINDGIWNTYTGPVTMIENGTIYAKCQDAASNWSTESSHVVSNIDKVIPQTPSGIPDITSPTNGNVLISVNYPTDALVKQYRIDSGTWAPYTGLITMISNGTVTLRCQDAAGNWSLENNIDISNIDKTAPVITINAYDPNPTNNDITVTATVNKGTLNVTSHTFTMNGSFDFVATDMAGNISIKTVTITNIDKEAPVITINPYNTEPTNKEVVVTASTNKGSLNSTSYIFTSNGSFEFVATDNYGNIAKQIVTITNIDKNAPLKPVISVDGNILSIISGIDNESGVKETRYQLNNGDWTVYADGVTLLDGTYVINAKTIDNAGNESDFAFYNAEINNNAITEATNTLVNAENTCIQADLDSALILIRALTDCPEKTDLLNRADILQKIINENNAISEATRALVRAEKSYVRADLDAAIALINALEDLQVKAELINRANILQEIIEDNEAISEATRALATAEITFTQSDFDIANALINTLPEYMEKNELVNRANNLQRIINGNKDITISTDAGEIYRMQMTDLVIKASDIENLFSMQLKIKYDPEMLELDQSNIKNLAWDEDQNGYSAININSSIGEVSIIYSLKGEVQGVSGNIQLMGLSFKTLNIGKSAVEVSHSKLVNSLGEVIKVSTETIRNEINILPNSLNVTLTGEKGQNDWYISPVTVEVSDLDAEEINYSINSDQYYYTQPFSIDENGEYNIIITTDDGKGFIKEKELVVKIDYDGPTISINNETYNWLNEVKVIPEFDDQSGSGILQSWYQWSDTPEGPVQWEEYNQGEISQEAEGVWYLHIKAIDTAGNVSQAIFGAYSIDRTVPVISVDIDKRDTWENTDVFVTPTFLDEGGSLLKYSGYHWSLDQSAPLEYITIAGPIHQNNDGAWYLHLIAEDWAGNTQTLAYGPYNIDKCAPMIEFTGVSEGMVYTRNVTPTISIVDTGSGIRTQSITLDGQAYTSGTPITEIGTHDLTVMAEDNCGNNIIKTMLFDVIYKPEAVINMLPLEDLTDTTPITWSYENSFDYNGGTIVSAEWQLDDNPVTTNPDGCIAIGNHTMKLRVQNNDNVWSDWVSFVFTVGNVYTIYPENVKQVGDLTLGSISDLFDGDLQNPVVFSADFTISGIEFLLLEPSTLYGLSGPDNDEGSVNPNGGMEVYKWNPATSTYELIGNTELSGSPNEWYQVYNFTRPGKYKMVVAQSNHQGFYEWKFKTAFSNPNTPPEAIISMSESSADNTMSISWSYDNSYDVDGDTIISAEWQLDDNPVTTNPDGVISEIGTHTMRLRVKDRKGVWSEWSSTTFEISISIE